VAAEQGERVLTTPHNKISIGVTLERLQSHPKGPSYFGSMLFTRNISGARVVAPEKDVKKSVADISFLGYGSHTDNYPVPYFTVAAAIGMTRDDVDILISRLRKVFGELK